MKQEKLVCHQWVGHSLGKFCLFRLVANGERKISLIPETSSNATVLVYSLKNRLKQNLRPGGLCGFMQTKSVFYQLKIKKNVENAEHYFLYETQLLAFMRNFHKVKNNRFEKQFNK